MQRISVPVDVCPIAPSGEQKAPGWTLLLPPPAGAVVFGGAGFVVVGFAAPVVVFGAGTPVAGTDAATDADGDADGDGDGDGDGESDTDADTDGDAEPAAATDWVPGFAVEPQPARASRTITATVRRRRLMR
ncbi:hypothetical protein GCM10009827_019590 [Dactylosporangium maewongense]|uniref:Uncharacterized protein n=1 Tax=Dactylosporangium maewongense TaxID=634393 RepID=A0ABN1ZWA6_9ACTN